MPAFAIRPAEAADRAVLLRHARELNIYEDAFTGNRATGEADAAATLDEALRRVAESGGAALVAEAEAAGVVGHLFLTLETAPPYVRAELRRHAYVLDAFVQAPWRGRGAFRALLAAADAHARAAGCRRVLIGVQAGNAVAERAYRGVGFRPYALEMIRDVPPRPAA